MPKKDILYDKTFAEFFAGIGLMRIGLEQVGWKISFANDIDQVKENIYKYHFQDKKSHFVLEDIHNLNGNDIPSVSLATASFPCTDLSLAGSREGLNGKHSSAFWGFIRILREMDERRPPLVLIENVDGFLTSDEGNDISTALLALNNLGYSVDLFTINAWHFVPQSRLRLFIVGSLTTNYSQGNFQKIEESEIRPKRVIDFIKSHPEINWSIRHLPFLPQRQINLEDIVDQTPDNSKEWWSEARVQYLLNQTSTKHRDVIEQAIRKDKFSYFTAFRRVRKKKSMAEIRSDGIAGCLRTPKGGSAKQILLKVGFGQVKIRLVSPTECAKLMGVPNYAISGSLDNALFGFGDAVCVPVITWIAENYLNVRIKEINNFASNKTDNEPRNLPVAI